MRRAEINYDLGKKDLKRYYNPMRDNGWLEQKLNFIWNNHFFDIPRHNEVSIKFGQKASTRLGSIKLIQNSKFKIQNYGKVHCHHRTLITITGHFIDERVPEEVIDVVIAHELAHYAHGFFSPLPQLARYPHHGGLVDTELKNRGFTEKLKFQKKWLKDNWKDVIGTTLKHRRTRRRSRKERISIFQFLIDLVILIILINFPMT